MLGRTAILQKTVAGCPWTVLRLLCYCQKKPWFRFSKRTSSVAELDLHLVAFTKNFKLFCCSVSWREPFCLTEYLRGRWKIRVFILATERNQLSIKSVHFDPLFTRSVFYWNAFRENLIIFFSGRVRGLL